MKKVALALALVGLLFGTSFVCEAAEETVLFDFENGLQGWDIPDWAYEKPDHVQREIKPSNNFAKQGKQSLEIDVEFPGGRWAGAIVEVMQYFDWSEYSGIAYDIYIPADAPVGLKTQMILTVGDAWKWVEMSRSYNLIPGQWVTVMADLKPGSIDWRRVEVDDSFRQDVRKVDIRVISNGKPAYTGSVYLDNIRLIK